jgi:hypothetical protein
MALATGVEIDSARIKVDAHPFYGKHFRKKGKKADGQSKQRKVEGGDEARPLAAKWRAKLPSPPSCAAAN